MGSAPRTLDANDMIYQFDASREYNPSTALDKITAPILATFLATLPTS